ncbi:PREDICTED: cytochrome P450 71D10 [Theobroma cacao]|uniref:Cytochrome P450 71D10 n=1 Tax=Theobroma cacao TaxID=3641 RepID=A0AB32UYW3_THECC|nr:PREDICTED: cytochrome P450 71D10 [Theobroma cacao]
MELQFPSFTALLLTSLFVFMVLKVLKRSKANNPPARLPPGPRKLPFIGNLHQLISSLPHHTLRDLAKKHGPLMHLQLGEVPSIVISSPEIAKEVLKDHATTFAQRPYLLASRIMSYDSVGIIFSPYGNYWKQLRKISTMELLSPSRVQSFQFIREEEVSALIKTISLNEGSPINLSEKIFSMTYGITSRAAFGKKSKGQEEFIRIITETTKLAGGFCLADMYPSNELLKLISGVRLKLEKLQRASDRILEDIVNEHKEKTNSTSEMGKQQGEEDLLEVLLKLQQSSDLEIPLTNDKIKAIILDILAAGSETSSTTMEWAMSEMLKNPKVMKQAQAEVRQVFDRKGNVDEAGIHELKFLRLIVKETLRLHPAAPLLVPRECDEKCVISGYDILAKTKVIVNAWAIGRDSRYWKDAEKFNPDRFLDGSIDFRGTNFEYIPFGAGRRICPGISFALPNIELPLAQLLYHFDWMLPNGSKCEDLDMTECFGLSVRRKNDLFLIPIPYHPLPSE